MSTSRLSSGQIRGVDHGRGNQLVLRGVVITSTNTGTRNEKGGKDVLMRCSALEERSPFSCTCITCPRAPSLVLEARERYVGNRRSNTVGEVPAEGTLSSHTRCTCTQTPLLMLEARQRCADSRRFLSSVRATHSRLVWRSVSSTYPNSTAFAARTEETFFFLQVVSTHVHEDACAMRPQAALDCQCLPGWVLDRKPSCLMSSRLVSSRLVPSRLVPSCLCKVYEAASTTPMYFLAGIHKSMKCIKSMK